MLHWAYMPSRVPESLPVNNNKLNITLPIYNVSTAG